MGSLRGDGAEIVSGPAVSVVRSGLNNPRHLTLTSDGLWWVAQA
jgi:hypothetical protein